MPKLVMDAESVERSITRIAHEILEKNKGTEDLALIGIQTRGVILAQRLSQSIEKITKIKLPIGILDINLYRDDLTKATGQPVIHKTEIDFNIDKKAIVLVDDVLYTGRTIRSAMNAIMDFGRPKRIELAVLVDRGHRELPVRADFVGKNIPTSDEETVQVKFQQSDGKEEVVIL